MFTSSSASSVCQALSKKPGCWGEGAALGAIKRSVGQTLPFTHLLLLQLKQGGRELQGPLCILFSSLSTALVLPPLPLCHMLHAQHFSCLTCEETKLLLTCFQLSCWTTTCWMCWQGDMLPKGSAAGDRGGSALGDSQQMGFTRTGKPFSSHHQTCLSLKGRNHYNLVITNMKCLLFYCNLKSSAKNSWRNKEGAFCSWLANSNCHNQQCSGDRGCSRTISPWQTATHRED